MFNQYPYTDYHELNTDWIIGKIKNVETAEANTKQYAEDADAAKVAAQDARDIAVAAKDDAVSAKNDAESAASSVADTRQQIDLLQARVDNIIPDGTQTAGNTELLDIRVAADGKIYDSAGNAVRGQVSILTAAEESFGDINLLNLAMAHDGYVWSGANTPALVSNADYYAYDPIPVSAGVTYYMRNIFEAASTYVGNGAGSRIGSHGYEFTSCVYVPAYDGEIYIAVPKTAKNSIVTTNEDLFLSYDQATTYTDKLYDVPAEILAENTGLYHKNLADNSAVISGYLYNGSIKLVVTAGYKALTPIIVKGGSRIYYKGVYGNSFRYQDLVTDTMTTVGGNATIQGYFDTVNDSVIYAAADISEDVLITYDAELYAQNTADSYCDLALKGEYRAINLLDEYERIEYRVYNSSGVIAYNALTDAYTEIPLKAGTTYYYRGLFAYFCMLMEGGIATRLDPSNTYADLGFGVYTPVNDCTLRITVLHTNHECLFTTDKTLYDAQEYVSSDIAKNVIIPNVATQRVYYVGTGEQYTRIRDAVADAIKYKGSKVIVRTGTYDLAAEFYDEIDADQDTENYGILLDNDVHVFFEPGTKVTMMIPDAKVHTETRCNPFYTNKTVKGGFILENLDIETNNTRYIVHDDVGQLDQNVSRTVKYINCRMKKTTKALFPPCIGGGMGNHDYIIIDNCYFEIAGNYGADTRSASYHNNQWYSTAQSNLIVSNNYFAGVSHFELQYVGSSQEISSTLYNNNSSGSALVIAPVSPADIYDQFTSGLVDFNNEVRP